MARSTRGAGLIKDLFIEDWDEIDRFIAAAWGPEHPLRDKELFLWQIPDLSQRLNLVSPLRRSQTIKLLV